MLGDDSSLHILLSGLTDVNAVRPKVPSCTAEQIDLQKCCDEVRVLGTTVRHYYGKQEMLGGS